MKSSILLLLLPYSPHNILAVHVSLCTSIPIAHITIFLLTCSIHATIQNPQADLGCDWFLSRTHM